jgi:hypothetical protein
MKINEFRNLIRKEIKSVLKEASIKYFTSAEIENILFDAGIEYKYDYTWSREDNLDFHNNKQIASKAKKVLDKNKVSNGGIHYLFGDYKIKIIHRRDD